MTSKHTPGPWQVDDYSADKPPRFFVVPSDYCGTICSIDPRAARATENARLIAAAPELLALLDEAHTVVIGWGATTECKREAISMDDLSDRIGAAIAKAKGEA